MKAKRNVLLAALCLPLLLGATPGDIGGCGGPVEELDAPLFFASKKDTDCKNCQRCGFTSEYCADQCDEIKGPPQAFASGCLPLARDGEVCLRKLQQSDCDELEPFLQQLPRANPSECQFCPEEGP